VTAAGLLLRPELRYHATSLTCGCMTSIRFYQGDFPFCDYQSQNHTLVQLTAFSWSPNQASVRR
jgi:hypothetical protein